MKIEFNTLKQMIFGAIDVWEEDGFVRMCRFSKSQKQFFDETFDRLCKPIKACASSNMYMDFYTDSENFEISTECIVASGKSGCWFDIYVDDIMVDNFGYPEREDKSVDYSLKLNPGNKRITVYFSGLYETKIKYVKLDDGASITTLKKDRKLLFLGDSITQGYITEHPSLAYTDVVTRKLGAEGVNQGIGGNIFNKDDLDENLSFKPDTVFVAFGTNDWALGLEVDEHVTEFFDKLTKIYSDCPIYVLLPIWRTNIDQVIKEKELSTNFEQMHENLRAACKGYDNIKVIDGYKLLPHSPEFLCDDGVHPNTKGFVMYGTALTQSID